MKQHEPELELDPAHDRHVTDALNSLEPLEPPAAFVTEVMSRVKPAAVHHSGGRVGSRQRGGGPSHAKKLLIGVIGLAAAGVLAVYVSGGPRTAGSGTEGTIGAAQRYQVDRNRRAAVNVASPEVQAFMQTTAYDRLIHDAQAMAALADPDVASALGDVQVQQVLGSPAFQTALAGATSRQFQASPEVEGVLAEGVKRAIASPGFQAALATPGLRAALASPEFVAGLATRGFVSQLQALSAAGGPGSGTSLKK